MSVSKEEIMEVVSLIGENLTGEPLKDAFIIGIYFISIWTLIQVIYESVFTIFKKNQKGENVFHNEHIGGCRSTPPKIRK